MADLGQNLTAVGGTDLFKERNCPSLSKKKNVTTELLIKTAYYTLEYHHIYVLFLALRTTHVFILILGTHCTWVFCCSDHYYFVYYFYCLSFCEIIVLWILMSINTFSVSLDVTLFARQKGITAESEIWVKGRYSKKAVWQNYFYILLHFK